MKTFLITLILITSFTAVKAQDFIMTADTMMRNTQGYAVVPDDCSKYSEIFYNYLRNNTTGDLAPYHWKIILKDLPFGWFLCQFCDNNLCRNAQGSGASVAWANAPYEEKVAALIPVGDSGYLEPAIAVPIDGDNGCGVLRVRVWTANTIDTATFIVCKNPTGVSKIAVNDSRVNIYPNPANDNILVYSEKSLNAANLSIISITGQTVDKKTMNSNKEAHDINISALPKGTYLIRLTNDKGQLITSRKFIKE